jgi:DNA repair exonuclease SbcCD ATPase subunit
MYVRKVEIKNLRCFDAAELTLRHREEDLGLALPNVTLLLGNNGGGKSTIMRAIALAVLSPILPSSGD